jgi:primosomal protein N' (replication factor Y)
VEDELAGLLPRATVLRLDFDSTRRAGSYLRILRAFARGEADILLGTQMVAKGLDFPKVTLVGVIYADAGLNLPDFRSTERTFQLLTQVAGRAGRGSRRGEVVLQTFYPEHYALTAAAAQDYDAFFRREMEARRELGSPPFSRMANLLLDGAREERVIESAEALADHLGRLPEADSVRFLGPAPQPLSRLKGKHRWHLAMRAPRHALLRAACDAALALWEGDRRRFAGVRLTVDMDPVDLL